MNRILIADDEEVLRLLIVDTLEDEGYEIDTAEDGEEALQRFKEHSYDLIILDYMMPKMTGIEVVKEIRKESSVNILMLTAKSQQRDIDELQQAGANYYMAKPFSPLKLIEVVEEIIGK